MADALRAKGLEVFLPMQTVRRQWSDRVKIYSAPLFNCFLFCRFSLVHELMVLKTPHVFSIYECSGKPLPIPDGEIACLQRIVASHYLVEPCERPKTGECVEIEGDDDIRGVLVERGEQCRVAIGFRRVWAHGCHQSSHGFTETGTT